MSDKKPSLDGAKFTFGQDEDSAGRSAVDYQSIEVEAIKMDEPSEKDSGCYFVISTERWAVNDANELAELITRVEAALKAAQ